MLPAGYEIGVEKSVVALQKWTEEWVKYLHNYNMTLENRVKTLEDEVRTLKMRK